MTKKLLHLIYKSGELKNLYYNMTHIILSYNDY